MVRTRPGRLRGRVARLPDEPFMRPHVGVHLVPVSSHEAVAKLSPPFDDAHHRSRFLPGPVPCRLSVAPLLYQPSRSRVRSRHRALATLTCAPPPTSAARPPASPRQG